MTAYVLDASAVLRFADREAGWERVREILRQCVCAEAQGMISAVQWGEIAGNLRKRFGAAEEARLLSLLLPEEVVIITVTAERAVRAADCKVEYGIGYADAFALALAAESSDRILVTADFGFKDAAGAARIEFLPVKSGR